MTNEETIEKLYDLKLGAMAEAFREMLARPQDGGLSFSERMGLLVDREWLRRESYYRRGYFTGYRSYG